MCNNIGNATIISIAINVVIVIINKIVYCIVIFLVGIRLPIVIHVTVILQIVNVMMYKQHLILPLHLVLSASFLL